MSNDLVKRLRAEDPETGLRHSIASEAADRIQRLENALKHMIKIERKSLEDAPHACAVFCIKMARTALKEEHENPS